MMNSGNFEIRDNIYQLPTNFLKMNGLIECRHLVFGGEAGARYRKQNNRPQFNNILTLLTDPETRDKIFSIADALVGGKPVITTRNVRLEDVKISKSQASRLISMECHAESLTFVSHDERFIILYPLSSLKIF